ncbi:aminotransferase class V-fold PLP-dependent enzyme [Salinibacterium sp. TMP30]|uniref:aminotransferase class V-fold PLP-dependent enzyme n=1 Tax=Salinibacterium sp. TMP30 TaxID=3138237 RepID=UPI003139CE8B
MNSCRAQLAGLMGVNAQNIALVSSSSEALHRVVESIPWRTGGNVVSCDIEFPSVTLPLVSLKTRGVDVRIVANQEWRVSEDDIAASVDDNTQAIILSHVSYMSGSRFDLEKLSALARKVGALLIVDVTQSLGVVPVDATQADIVIASTYKWLLGAHGTGVVYIKDPESSLLQPEFVGWRSVQDMFAPDRFERFQLWPDARRWELGYPGFPSLYMLESSLQYLTQYSPESIEKHILQLGTVLLEGAIGHGMLNMTPLLPELRAGNIALRANEPVKLAQDLSEKGILAWGGDGRIRFSIHLFNDLSDVEAALLALTELVPSK